MTDDEQRIILDDEEVRLLRSLIKQAGKFLDEAAELLSGQPHNGRTELGAARGLLDRAKRLTSLCDLLVAHEKAKRGLP